jgi:four helix bundle suffix protein
MSAAFLPPKGNFRDLLAYQKSECVYDITFHFAHRFFAKGDRTIDQMVQAARSGKQNIAEGCAASTTSSETEIKLLNVAKASLQELLLDYEDYLRVRHLPLWERNNPKAERLRNVCAKHNDTAFYTEQLPERSDEVIANLAITLIHQADVLLAGYLERIKRDFLENGGIREQMTRARLDRRRQQGGPSGQ